jgi:hypothetical protein
MSKTTALLIIGIIAGITAYVMLSLPLALQRRDALDTRPVSEIVGHNCGYFNEHGEFKWNDQDKEW